MFEDTVNRANPIAGRINMSNLCSEILQVNSVGWMRIWITWILAISPVISVR
jgi:ribonucleotide reductase alpha subunit